MTEKEDFEKFAKEVEAVTEQMSKKESTATSRTGLSRLKNRVLYFKMTWGEALSFVSIIQSFVIFLALIPQAIGSGNDFLSMIGIGYQFPKQISSVVAVLFIIFVFIFGIIAVRYVGTITTSNEIGTKMSPSTYLLWQKLERMEERINKKEKKDGAK